MVSFKFKADDDMFVKAEFYGNKLDWEKMAKALKHALKAVGFGDAGIKLIGDELKSDD